MSVRQDKSGALHITAIEKRIKPADIKRFASQLFGSSATEDLKRYSPACLAALAGDAYKQMKTRKPGRHQARVFNPKAAAKKHPNLAHITIVEVYNDNMPFLYDSVLGTLQDSGANILLSAHPIINIERNSAGTFKAVHTGRSDASGVRPESCMHIHINRLVDDAAVEALAAEIDATLQHVRHAVRDWRAMLRRIEEITEQYSQHPPAIPMAQLTEAINFLRWLQDNNFTFLGIREYLYKGTAKSGKLVRRDTRGLGILSDPHVRVLRRGREMVTFTPEIREFLQQPTPLIVTKANVKSRVHRRTHMDYIGVKLFDADGKLLGELRIVGLFTSTAYTRSVGRIPYIRHKLDEVLKRTGYSPDSHNGKALINIVEQYPRDELFQIDGKMLSRFAVAILQLSDRPRIRVLVRSDRFDRFVSVIVYVPRDHYSTHERVAIGHYLKDVFKGRLSAYYPSFPEGALARVHYIIGRSEGKTPRIPQARLEQDVADIVRTWEDGLAQALKGIHDAPMASRLSIRYKDAFSAAYRDSFDAKAACQTIAVVEALDDETGVAAKFGAPEDKTGLIRLHVFNRGGPIPLSERVPLLENMGFKVISERSYGIEPAEASLVMLHDMLIAPGSGPLPSTYDPEALEACFLAVRGKTAEDDGYNALVLNAGIDWVEASLVRTLSRYLRQVRIPYSQDYMWETINKHAGVAKLVIDLFAARFQLKKTSLAARKRAQSAITKKIEAHLAQIASLDEDTILRRFANAVTSALRTNYYKRDSAGKRLPAIAIKFDPEQLTDLPEPRPFREIFVYSPRVEGVHLRGGPIARGGLRWSDRPQDFRTEILGLAKAQQVKNAVIVPVGAKGGFVPQQLPTKGGRDAFIAEGIASYKIFIAALLSVTDNLDGEKVIYPQDVIRHEADDPYLVVAADKGTATFSDIANGISQEHGFWLDDAFASGGSAGYDHKKMGITARGGWEAVKRHFRERNHDIQSSPFMAVGVGDMSGDVFGNGMLLSKHTKLIAAFDHRDIFIDPDPDVVKSFKERQRLFRLARSSWQDYNKSLISEGGGVFSRREKAITLPAQAQAAIGMTKKTATPFEIITAILKADVDLLWFGGIGTYVRASFESDAEVGDRANDGIRITAREVGAKVVGEGANLGMTQDARIEYGLAKGRSNTDAIDNSGGVNSSDLEVNIKIALGSAVRAGRLSTPKRNTLLAAMTKDVATLVLRNNYLQTLSLSMSEQRGMAALDYQARLMSTLEGKGSLDRVVENLPDAAALEERRQRNQPLTRPEISVLLAYAKIDLFSELINSAVPDDPYLEGDLLAYFPAPMRKTYAKEINNHRLRREIIATEVSNAAINRGGSTYVLRVADQTGASPAEIGAAYIAVRDSLRLLELNNRIDALDNRIDGQIQLQLYQRVQDVLLSETVWFIRRAGLDRGLGRTIDHFRSGIDTLRPKLSGLIPPMLVEQIKAQESTLVDQGVPAPLAQELQFLGVLGQAPNIVIVADRARRPLLQAAQVYFDIASIFRLGLLEAQARALPVEAYYDRLALDRALALLDSAHRRLAIEALRSKNRSVAGWRKTRAVEIARTVEGIGTIRDGGLSVAKLSVAAGLLSDLVQG